MNTTLLGIRNAASRYNIAATRNSESPLVGILTPPLGIRDGGITPLGGIISPLLGIIRVFSDEKIRIHRG